MILDAIVLVLCLISFFRGWKKGLLWAICSLIAVVIAVIVSLKLSQTLANYLFETNLLTNQYTLLISFIVLFVGTIFLFRTVVKFAEKILETFFLGWINHLLGAMLYAFFMLFIISTFLWLTSSVNLLNTEQKLNSKTYTYVQPLAPKTVAFITPYMPYFKTLYTDLQLYFSKVSNEKKIK